MGSYRMSAPLDLRLAGQVFSEILSRTCGRQITVRLEEPAEAPPPAAPAPQPDSRQKGDAMPRYTRTERAKHRLSKLGYTQQELAEAIGYSRALCNRSPQRAGGAKLSCRH